MGSVDSVTGATLLSWLVAVVVVDTVVLVFVVGLDLGTYVVVVVVGGCCDMVFVIVVAPPPYILLGVDAGVGGSCVGTVLPFGKVVSDGFFQVPLFEYRSGGGCCCCDDDDVSIHCSEIATTDDGDEVVVVVVVVEVAFVVAVVIPVESY
jgi:hypothetical protein